MTEKYDLSRRKVLGGLATIGVAGAGVGLGTSALYSDTETFVNNQITAGTLNLILKGGIIATNREGGISNSDVRVAGANAVENDGEIELVLELSDVKPGDCYILHTDECIEGNPAYLEMSFEEVEDLENGYTEPEPVDNNGEGELDDLMEVTAWYGGYSEKGNTVDPANVTCDNIGEVALAQLIETQTLQDAFDGLAQFDENDPSDASAHEAFPFHQTDVSQDFVPGVGGGSTPVDPSALDPGCYRKFWEFHLPKTVGNEVQGDSVKFNINARVEQARNNENPFNGS